MKKDLMTRDLERHDTVRQVVSSFIKENYELYESHSFATGYFDSMLVQILTYHVTERVRQDYLEQLARGADKAREEHAYKILKAA